MSEMKSTNVPWIGDIPVNWEVKAIRYLVRTHFSGSWGTNEQYNSNDRICMRIADFDFDKMQFKVLNSDEYTVRNYSNTEINKKTLRVGDLLIEKSGGGKKNPVGRTVVYRLPYNALFANFMNCIRLLPDFNVEYAKYVFFSLYKRGVTNLYFKQTTGLQNLDLTRYFREVKVPVPPLETQQSIAKFLDNKCHLIDSLVEDIQSQIETLSEYKKSVITEAVTKGLNPDVEMKINSIPWLDDVPIHWDILPLYCCFDERKNKNSFGTEQNLLSLSYGRIIRKDINTNGGLLPASFNTYNIVEAGDIIIRPTDLQNDKRSLRTGYVNEKGIITSAYIALKSITDLNSKYVHYLLHSYDVMKVFYNMGNGVRQGLNFDEFKKLLILKPPKEEQDAVVDYLDAKCSEIDAIISEKKEQLSTLAEYKKSLIYEYVTGKKEVAAA